jgi:hypothetical protein
MKPLILAVSALIMLTIPGWGQDTPNRQAQAAAKAHRQEAQNNPERPHHKRKHRRHRHHHNPA